MLKERTRAKKRSKPDKRKAARKAQEERRALENLWEKRRPFESLLHQIVTAVLHAEAPEARESVEVDSNERGGEQTWLEVGSGIGQLRSLLPSEICGLVTHTDLSASLVRALVERYPTAHTVAANVTQLPFETASVDVVLGLCAFDSFAFPDRASREIARVLREGGRFIHFLDAATNVEPVIIELVDAGRLPLPNFFADIALRNPELFDGARLERFVQPYADILSVPFVHFNAILELLRRAGHPLVTMLERYSGDFSRRPFELLAAARTFVKLTSDPATGRPMNQALMSLFTTLQQPPYSEQLPFDLQVHSSLAHFKARLEHYFGPDFGYELRLSTIVYARDYELDDQAPLRARVRRVGMGQNCLEWPAPMGTAAHQLKHDLPNPEVPNAAPDTHVLREAAVYCLVAEARRALPHSSI